MTKETRNKYFAWLDANASVLTVNQLYEGLSQEFQIKDSYARVIASQWRASNGVQRKYRKAKQIGGE